MPVTKIAFLDTQVFDQELYDFDSTRFRRLKQLVNDGHAKIVITEITRREIVARVRDTTAKSLQALKRVRKKVREVGILRHLTPRFADLFARHDMASISDEIVSQFNEFCKDLRVEVLSLALAADSLASIVDDYFESRPPFREGRKRSEFPDAIACDILRRWCIESKKKEVFVVTDDPDWEDLCGKDGLTHVKSLTGFLAMFPDPDLAAALVVGLRGPSHDLLCDRIAEQFMGLGFVTGWVDGEVEDVDDVEVSMDDIVIVEAGDCHAVAEVSCEVSFSADVTYEVDGTGIWDSEDHVMRFVEHDSATVQDTVTLVVEVKYEYDKEDPTCMVNLESLEIDAWDVEVDCSDLSQW